MKRCAPAAERNGGPITDVLARCLPPAGTVLEIASGTGQHVCHFAAAFPGLWWQPSDLDPTARDSVAAWIAEAAPGNVAEPVAIDASRPQSWPIERADALVNINMIHIAPWAACEGLFEGAGRILPAGAPLFLYGPFVVADVPTAPSNEAFDASLRARDPSWGLRHLDDVTRLATERGFERVEVVPMPANNLSVIFRRTGEP